MMAICTPTMASSGMPVAVLSADWVWSRVEGGLRCRHYRPERSGLTYAQSVSSFSTSTKLLWQFFADACDPADHFLLAQYFACHGGDLCLSHVGAHAWA